MLLLLRNLSWESISILGLYTPVRTQWKRTNMLHWKCSPSKLLGRLRFHRISHNVNAPQTLHHRQRLPACNAIEEDMLPRVIIYIFVVVQVVRHWATYFYSAGWRCWLSHKVSNCSGTCICWCSRDGLSDICEQIDLTSCCGWSYHHKMWAICACAGQTLWHSSSVPHLWLWEHFE